MRTGLFFSQFSTAYQLLNTCHFCDEFEFTSRPKADDAGAAKRRFDQLFGG
jgi:hypothetical protein